jgi:hypothetical protein
MRKILTIAFILICSIASAQTNKNNVWTKEYEQGVYTMVYQQLGGIIKDEAVKKDMSVYTVAQLKTALPGGLLSVPSDSLRSICTKIGTAYAMAHKAENLRTTLAWGPDVEKSIEQGMLSTDFLKNESQALREKACDCFISELKKVYPDTIRTPFPDSVTRKIFATCEAQLHIGKN